MRKVDAVEQLAYIRKVNELTQRITDSQTAAILKGSRMVATSVENGGVLHVFGAGHSHIVAEECAARAGGLAPVNPVLDYGLTLLRGLTTSTAYERLESYGSALFAQENTNPGEVIVVISQSGINCAPVEVALAAKARGLSVIAVTSVTHSQLSKSRHSSGKRLFEVADLVIDNCVDYGDAAVSVRPDLPPVGPLSTVASVVILNSLVVEAATILASDANSFPVWVSINTPGGDEHNRSLIEKYGVRLSYLCR